MEAAIQRFIRHGYRLTHRTPESAQLIRPKTFSVLWSVLWFLLCGVGVLVYIFYYMGKKDSIAYLSIDGTGQVVAHVSR